MNPVEQIIYESLVASFGSPVLLGAIFLLFILGIVVLSRLSLDGALAVLVPALFVVAWYIPQLQFVIGLGIGFIIFFLVIKIWRG